MGKLSAVAEAYARAKPVRDLLFSFQHEHKAQCMEATEDKCGIVWERWLIETKSTGMVSVVLFATPSWWDLFAPITNERGIEETLNAIREFAQR